MNDESELNADLTNIMTDFFKIKESYLNEHSLKEDLQRHAKDLQEENKVLRDLEEMERSKLNISQKFTVTQQDTITNLLEVKSENTKLSEYINQLEAALTDLKRQFTDEKKHWQTDQEKLKLYYAQEMKELKLTSEKKVLEAGKEIVIIKRKFDVKYVDLGKQIEKLQKEKLDEITAIEFEYEGRLHKLEENIKVVEAENRYIRDRAASDIILLQKKSLALEQQYNNVIQGKENLLCKSSDISKPGATGRRKSFQYNIPSNINQNQSTETPLQSILKKTSVYGSGQISCDKKIVFPSLDDFTISESAVTRDVKSMKYNTNTAQIHAEKSNFTPMILSVATNKCINNITTKSIVMPQLQFVKPFTNTQPDDKVANASLKEAANSSLQEKKTPRKRKLFCPNIQDIM